MSGQYIIHLDTVEIDELLDQLDLFIELPAPSTNTQEHAS